LVRARRRVAVNAASSGSDGLLRLALESLFTENPDAMYILATDGRFLAGNRALADRTGVPWEQLREMGYGPTVHPDERERVAAEFAAAAAGSTRTYQTRGILPDGTPFDAEVVNAPIFRDGEVIGVVGTAHDIGELADVRRTLDRSEARLAAALDGISDAVAFVDEDWRITFLNSRATSILGRGAVDLVGTSLWDLDLPDPEGAEMLRESMRTRRRLVRRRFDEGLQRWMEVTGFPAGELLGISVRDVTEVEEARRQIIDDSRRIHAQSMLMDSARDAIVMRGLSGVIEYANAAAQELLGDGVLPTIEGLSLSDLLRLDEDTTREIEGAIGRDGRWEGEIDFRRVDGAERITENLWQAVDGADGVLDVVFCVITDVTERRAQDEMMARTQRMESIGTLASGIAHDLNNVLTPLLLSTQLLAADEVEPQRQRILEGMRSTVERGGAMIRQVLTFARGVEGDKTVVDIAALTQRFADFCRDILPKDIQVEVSSGDGLAVLGDSTQLLQVLMNLATNARDAMPDGGRLSLTASRDGDRVVIEVSDDGDGVSPDALARIFEPFYTTKGVGRGTGLGLSVSQAIARTHGGSLEARSTLGSGTTFRLDLPSTEWTAEECPDLAPGVRLDGLRVLIVDDEDEIVDLAALVVSGAGGIALGATDALDAQRLLDDSPVDVIVSDLVMPGTSGREFLGWLGANLSSVPVVAMSGIPEQGAHAARRANVRATLDKPFTADQLIAAILTAASGSDA
jgi:two-component system, cell cycle sensor histidine kinase and response regulator CckA